MHNMTHYMELLATNQPWNLILFMVIPVVLAEFVAITELYILYKREEAGVWKQANRVAGILAGFYFLGVFIYLFVNAVIPLTATGGWRGITDIIAVGFYLLGVVPLLGIALLDLGALKRNSTPQSRIKLHATFVGLFLVVAHIAMVFGMLDPTLLA